MNGAHIHLIVNHVPVVGMIFSTLLLAIAWLRRSEELTRTAMAMVILTAVAGVITFLTGDLAEDVVTKLGDYRDVIEHHEEMATATLVAASVLGLATIFALMKFRHRMIPRWVTSGLLIGALGGSVLLGLTAEAGGRIRHTEIRPGFVPPPR